MTQKQLIWNWFKKIDLKSDGDIKTKNFLIKDKSFLEDFIKFLIIVICAANGLIMISTRAIYFAYNVLYEYHITLAWKQISRKHATRKF